MTQKLQPVRGTHDILPDDFEKFQAVVTRARELATLYGFREMATPIFEATDVFSRSMGETSDVVSKEMFNFETKGGESVCLRPEFTAGIARAFISNGMQQHLPLKLFSTGPLFRYERPQKGRQRQFHQVNFEWLGDDSPEADVDIILLAGQLLFAISGQKSTLHINTLGDAESREKYRNALVAYLTPHQANLSEDSQRRLEVNPLRILDSKDPRDREIIVNAPKIIDHLNEKTKDRFAMVCKALECNKEIDFFIHDIVVDYSLVRGLDYYTDIVFEFIGNSGDLGAQNTLLAGGRYDGLIEQMGGKPTPAIGFAAGVERLLLSLSEYELKKYDDLRIFIVPSDDATSEYIYARSGFIRLKLWSLLRNSHSKRQCSLEVLRKGNQKKRMEHANKHSATHVIKISDSDSIIIKNMKTSEEQTVDILELNNTQKLIELFNITELDPDLRRDDKKEQ